MSGDLIAEANRLAAWCESNALVFGIILSDPEEDDPARREKMRMREKNHLDTAECLRALAAALAKAEAELAKAEWWNVADDPERSVEDPHDLWAEGDAGLDDVIQFWGARSTGCVWAAQIVLTWHDGEPDDVDVQTFQTKDEAVAAQEAARATLAQAQGGGDE